MVRLLVSVRSADEVRAALEGGADIIDAKEPNAGALGPVRRDLLPALLSAVPRSWPVSVALGEAGTPVEAAQAIRAVPLGSGDAARFVKLAVRARASGSSVSAILAAAAAAARDHPSHPSFVAVAYADAYGPSTAAAELAAFVDRAFAAGAAGVLVDTERKDGPGLVDRVPLDHLARWVAYAKGLGLLVAVAGRIGLRDLPALCSIGADVVGVRGAVCVGGRSGRTDAALVRQLKRTLERWRAPLTSSALPRNATVGRVGRLPGDI